MNMSLWIWVAPLYVWAISCVWKSIRKNGFRDINGKLILTIVVISIMVLALAMNFHNIYISLMVVVQFMVYMLFIRKKTTPDAEYYIIFLTMATTFMVTVESAVVVDEKAHAMYIMIVGILLFFAFLISDYKVKVRGE